MKDEELSKKREEAFAILYDCIRLLRKRRSIVKKIGEIKKASGFKLEDYGRESEIYDRLKPNKVEEGLINVFLLDSLRAQGWSLGCYKDSEYERIDINAEQKIFSVEELKSFHKTDYVTVMGSRKEVFISWLLSLKIKRIALLNPVGKSWEDLSWSFYTRPYRVSNWNIPKNIPVFAQSPNRFGLKLDMIYELSGYSLVDLTFSSEKLALGESLYMYSPACVAGQTREQTVVFSNKKRLIDDISKIYKKIFGSINDKVFLCDEKNLKKSFELSATLYKKFEAVKWEEGPFIALNKRVAGSIDASSYGDYPGIYVLNMFRVLSHNFR
ncbi:MAG: chorismate mutase [Nitrososphaeria archaeon]